MSLSKKDVAGIIRLIVEIIIAVLVLGGGGALVLAAVITKPIFELTEAAKAVSAGNLERKVPVRTKDEIGQLAIAFNKMFEGVI